MTQDEQKPPQQWTLKLGMRGIDCDLLLNGESVRGVTSVRVSADVNGVPTLEITLIPASDITIEGVPGQVIINRTEHLTHTIDQPEG